MKILVIAPTPFFSDRGTHIRILEEALALEKLGHRITLATYHIGRNINLEVKNKIDVRRILRLLFWYKKLEAGPDWQKVILDLLLLRKVFFLARTQRPDIIHGHLHEGVLIGWLVKKVLFWRKIKLVADFHGSLTKEMVSHGYLQAGILNKFFAWLEKIIDNLGDYAVTSSWENTGAIKKFRKDNKVETILDGVNLDYYQKFSSRQRRASSSIYKSQPNAEIESEIYSEADTISSKEISKRELELPLDKTVVTYTGALIVNKGIGYLLSAIPLALAQNQQLFFILAGFPIAEAKKFVKEKKLEKNVRIISPLNYFDLPEILNASDIAIDPKDESVNQASGKILQYMGAGLPIICFDKDNNRRYLGEGGYYVPEFSAEGLAKGISELAGNREKIQEMGRKNKERAKNFSWNISAEKLNQVYNKLIINK